MADAAAWGDVAKKYAIHKETLSHFRQLEEMGIAKPLDRVTPEELRASTLRRSELFAGQVDFEGSEKEFIVPSEGNNGGVPVSVYKPSESKRVPAILVFFHGGGLVTGSRGTHATLLKILARRAGCVVVNVEYRLAPEHKAPAAFDDCRAVTQWVLNNKVHIGGHKDSQVGVGGDSTGGRVAASVAHDVKGLAFQVLVYPDTDSTMSVPSYAEFAKSPGLNKDVDTWCRSHSLVGSAQNTHPVIYPFYRPSFTGLPPALCVLAQLDPVRDDGLAYCEKLKAAGVPTEVLLVKGAAHSFFHHPAHYKELTKEPYDRCVSFLNKFQQV